MTFSLVHKFVTISPMPIRGRRSGFTLVETLMTLSIMALMLAVVGVNLRAPRERADAKAAAEVLLSSLRQARQLAISEGRTVALAIPTSNGSLQHGGGFYRLVGETRPQVVQKVDFSGEYSGVGVFGGQYPGPSWSTTFPPGLSTDGFDLATWNAPYPQDHMVAFLPNGVVTSNLPLGNGSYRLVVGKTFSYSGTPAALSAVEQPVTVAIQPSGEIQLHPGLHQSSGVALQAGTAGPGAALPALSSVGNADPQLVAPHLQVNPAPIPEILANHMPAGTTATVPSSGLLTFTVFATDPDGDQLWCNWSGPGTFSSADGSRMVWDETKKHWVGQWTWRVPANAAVNDQFTLSCQVYDNRGGVTTPLDVGLTMPKPTVIQSQSLLCAMLDGAYRWNWDGTGAFRIVSEKDVGGQITKVRWSPDFSLIALASGKRLFLVGPEGENLQLLDSLPADIDAICWAPSGLQLYVLSDKTLFSLRPDVGNPGRTTVLSALGLDTPTTLTIHPDGAPLLTSDRSSGELLVLWPGNHATGVTSANPDPNPRAVRHFVDADESHTPVFSRDGTRIYFRCREPNETGLCYNYCDCTVNANTQTINTGPSNTILLSQGSGSAHTISPDGLFLAGGMDDSQERLSICPVTATGPDQIIDVTAVPPDNGRRVVDVDWGYY